MQKGKVSNMIPYGKHSITKDDLLSVEEALKSNCLTQGNAVPVFEAGVRDAVASRFAVATNSATSALHIACLSLGVSPGKRVWTSPITFVASANCALYCGAEVDFVDIDPKTALLCMNSLEQKLIHARNDNSLPDVVIPVHLCGASCDMRKLHTLSCEYGFKIIEDASHAIGGQYEEVKVGSCFYSDITIFSFHPVKIITTGEGGMATTNDEVLANRMRELRSHGITREHKKFRNQTEGAWHYEQVSLGFNYRMTDIQAALGISQLKRLDSVVKERRRLFFAYKDELERVGLSMLSIPENVLSAHHLAVVSLSTASPDMHKRVFSELRKAGIGVQLHYIPVHTQPFYEDLGFVRGMFPEAESYSRRSFSIPLFPGLTEEQQRYVVESLDSVLRAC